MKVKIESDGDNIKGAIEGVNRNGKGGERFSEFVIKFVVSQRDREFAGINVSTLAQLFEMDRTKLSRNFKREAGMALDDYIHREKMFRAAYLLRVKRSIAVKEVAKQLGYCTTDYFIMCFKKFFGIVPGQYKDCKKDRSGKERRIFLDRRKK
ncbi:MAG: helix-turn-helix transcriptional regulator, partial [bacterium]|nr:helix-turn-helix transcriptional regulator [bacterium]